MIARFLAALLFFGAAAWAEESSEEGKKELALVERHVFPLLKEADQVVIYSLYPIPPKDLEKEIDNGELATAFDINDEKKAAKLDPADRAAAKYARTAETTEGYPVLGKAEIKEAADRLKVLEEIRTSMTAWQDSDDCHDPRHGILIVKGEQPLWFSICFSCGTSYLGGAPEAASEAFNHFNDDLQDSLEVWLDAAGAARRPYREHPVKPAK